MARPVGSRNKTDEEKIKDIQEEMMLVDEVGHMVSKDPLITFIGSLMANPNIYPKHGDSAIIAMAKRMIKEIQG